MTNSATEIYDDDLTIIDELSGYHPPNDEHFLYKDNILQRINRNVHTDLAEKRSNKLVQSELTHILRLENNSNFCYVNVVIQLLICCGRLFWDVLFSNENTCDFSSLFINNYLLPYQNKANHPLSSQILREFVQEMLSKKPDISYLEDKQQDPGSFF